MVFFLGVYLAWDSYVCEIPEDAEVSTMSYSFDPADYRELYFHLDEGITGDIYVSQSRDRTESNITLKITAQGSTPQMLSAITLRTNPNPRTSLLETSLLLDMSSSDLRRALSKNCTNVEVDIIFPRRLFSYDLLQLESHFKGNVQVRLDDRDTATTMIKSLEILAKEGNVGVRDVVVTRAMNIVARSGAVEGKAEVERVVRVSASKGVDLELESRTNTMEVKVNSNRHAQVTMRTPFFGHLAIKTTSYYDRPELFVRCCFYQQKVNNNTLIGFVSYTGYEPGYLPRIDIKGDTARLDLLA